MAGSAASVRALIAANPMASVEATATGELITGWLQITAVPLLVFLIGACIWGCIENRMAWKMLTEDGGIARNEVGPVQADSSRSIDSNHATIDLEAGLELSQACRRDDDRDVSLDSTECIGADVHVDGQLASPCETTSDIGDVLDC